MVASEARKSSGLRILKPLSLMRDAGFTEAELAKLTEAKNNSDDLVRIETVAMNMVKGLYDDGGGAFTRKAEPKGRSRQPDRHEP